MSLTQEEIYTLALHAVIARGYGQREHVKYLISLGASITDPKCIDNAVEFGGIDSLSYLVEECGRSIGSEESSMYPVGTDIKEKEQEFYLTKACKCGYGFTVQFLADRSSKKTLTEVLKYAIKNNLPFIIIEILISTGKAHYENFVEDSNGLYYATIYANTKVIQYLQQCGAKVTDAIRNLGK